MGVDASSIEETVVFVTLEDETGCANATIWPALFERARLVINLEPALMIAGELQNESGVIHVVAELVEPLPSLAVPLGSSPDYHWVIFNHGSTVTPQSDAHP